MVVMPPLRFLADDFRLFQDVAKRVADALQIPFEEVKDTHHKLLVILHSSSSSRITLPINKVLLDPSKLIWQTPSLVTHTCKWADKEYYVVAKDTEFLFSHPLPNSIVVDAVNSLGPQHQVKSTPYDSDRKRLDLFGRKAYLSTTL